MSQSKIIKKALLDWIQTSTSHGFPNFFRTERPINKFIWFTCTLTSLVVCAIVCIQSVLTYFSFEVNSSINRIIEIPTSYPMITICNTNPYLTRESHYFYSKQSKKVENFPFNSSLNKERFTKYFINSNTLSLSDEELKQFSFLLNDIIITCSFNNAPCNTLYFTWFYDLDYGNCFIFNSGKLAPISKVPSATSALRLELFVGQMENSVVINQNYGAVLYIGNQSFYPNQFEKILLPVGFETNILVSRSFTSKLSSPYSDCIFKKDITNYKELFSNYEYSQTMCLAYCLEELIVELCGCYSTLFKSLNMTDIKPCTSISNVTCVYKANLFYLNGNLSSKCLKKCPNECNHVSLDASVSIINYPSTSYANILTSDSKIQEKFSNLINVTKLTNEILSKNILSVNVMYKDLDYTLINENANLKVSDLISSIGGILGLFIGVSFLSFVEILEIIVEIIYIKYEFKNKVNTLNPDKI